MKEINNKMKQRFETVDGETLMSTQPQPIPFVGYAEAFGSM